MLRQIRFHNFKGPWRFVYAVDCTTLYKPKQLRTYDLDVCEHHFAFLDGSREPVTYNEKRIHALLIHEDVHSERKLSQRIWLRWWWSFRYQHSRSFRRNEELIAYRTEFEKLVEYGVPISFEWYAQSLSGPIYRGMICYDEALEWVRTTVTSMSDVEYAINCLDADEWFRRRRRMAECAGELEVTKPSTPPAPFRRDRYWLADRLALVACGILAFVAIFLGTLVSIYVSTVLE